MLRWLKYTSLVLILSTTFSFHSFRLCENSQLISHLEDNIEFRVDSLLSLMTLQEKIGQMSQVRHFDDIKEGDIKTKLIGSIIHTEGPTPGKSAEQWQQKFIQLQKEALSTRLGIPLLIGVDAVHGQNTFNGATIFPHNIGLGATGNANLVKKIAEITALEAQACGFNWVFSPCAAVPYNERWGRFYEAYSENSELTTQLTQASILGLQGRLDQENTVMACAKHFFGDGATDYGDEGGITSVSRKEAYQRLITPYKAAVNAKCGSIMASFNSYHSISMHAHKDYILDTLKLAMQYDGMVVSDWRGYSRFGGDSIIQAGIDMVMAVNGGLDSFQNTLRKSVESGVVSMERIDDAVRRILRQKFRLGLFENPFPNKDLIAQIGRKEHRDLARRAVRESLVLLKNDGVLPLDKELSKIVIVGEHANNTGLQSGGWTIHWQGTDTSYFGSTTILQGIDSLFKGELVYDSLATMRVSDADLAILIVGEKPYAEFLGDIDGVNEHTLTLSSEHRAYLRAYKDLEIPMVVVLLSGRPLVVTEELEQSNGFVAAWLPGSEGLGVAEVLFGDYNFTGKLAHSWAKSVTDFDGLYGPNYWDSNITPLFPIGYGLSYTNFER